MIPQGSLLGMFFLSMVVSTSLTLSTAEVRAEEEGTPPKLISSCMVQPAYPQAEREAGIEGTVFLSVQVKEDGSVGVIKAKEEVPGHPAFTASATAAIGKWCFEPAQRDGKPVESTVVVPVRFRLDEKKK